MGYGMSQVDSNFHMDAAKVPEALKAVKAMQGKFSWVPHDFQKFTDFPLIIGAWMWDIELDSEGNVIEIQFEGESLGDEDALFGAFAPFVKAGSYIDMVGEDGERWRWAFDGTKCENKAAKISY